MSVKAVLVLCAQALFIQSVFSQCISRTAIDASGINAPYGWVGRTCDGVPAGWAGREPAYNALYAPGMEFSATSGGGLPVTSFSVISPTGISVISDNAYEGAVAVTGEMPFVSAVLVEGMLPTAGAGFIDYSCGDGITAMVSAEIAPAAFGPAGPYGPGIAYGPAGPFGPAPAMGPAAAFGPAAFGTAGPYDTRMAYGPFGPAPAMGPAAAFGPASRFGFGRCDRGLMY